MPANLDPNAADIANRQLTSIPFRNLIGGPLNAVVEAQAQAAKTTADFIMAVALTKDAQGQEVVRNVTFRYEKGGQDVKLVVPILTIIPVPYIRVDDMTIQFKASIEAEASAQDTSKATEEMTANLDVSASYLFFKADFNASYSSKKDSTATQNSKYSVQYTMDVYVHAVQDDMPGGLAKVLQILQDSIEIAPAISLTASPARLTIVTGKDAASFDLEITPKPAADQQVTLASSNINVITVESPASISASTGKVTVSVKKVAEATPGQNATVTVSFTPPGKTTPVTQSVTVTIA